MLSFGYEFSAKETFVANDSFPSINCQDTLGVFGVAPTGQFAVFVDSLGFPKEDSCGSLEYRIWYACMDSVDYPDQSHDWILPDNSSPASDVLHQLPNAAIFYCGTLEPNLISTFDVRIYAISQNGNWAFCEAQILVVDSFLVCDQHEFVVVDGNVRNRNDAILTNAIVEFVGGPFNALVWSEPVDQNGNYLLDVTEYYDWELSATKDDEYLNGLTAHDLSILSRHIAGVNILDDQFELFAADINGDLTIDIRDVLVLRKLLLGIIEESPGVPAWKLIDAKYDFLGLTNYALPDAVLDAASIKFIVIDRNYLDADFIGVKTGDLDGDAEIDK